MTEWTNRLTREAYVRVLEDWPDPMAFAREWLDVGQGSAVAVLARRLRREFRASYGRDQGDFLVGAMHRAALRQVDWAQVAERLLARALPEEAPHGGEELAG
jgi:hypothetical protein